MVDSSGLIIVGAVMWFVHKKNAKRKSKIEKSSFNNGGIFAKAADNSTSDFTNASILINLNTQPQTVEGYSRHKNRPVL